MLTVLFYVLLCMAAAHFIYERILLPSLRLHYRNKLFELRDEVRNQIIADHSADNTQAAQLVHEALNNAINRLHLMTITNRVRARRRLATNPDIQAKINREIDLFHRCDSEVINKSIIQSAEILEKVYVVNNLMLIAYTFPIYLAIATVAKVVKAANSLLALVTDRQSLERAVMLLPDRQVARLVEADNFAYA
ncbi:hypothetical protein SNN71_001202 [Cronobacter sakazakii]|uniref:hypothetical protein n=1 Tax=Cronobacter sakazakii TaxID=28141 RepID=UPI001EC589E8|nr:hypothetical protein [Cronobacter sakazakii]EGT4441755.1 hypothetical protein [Cronobacter sakazakii]ELY5781007.1 hypothetical protein [Cronobacter sakazakii]UNM57401.1 hypothetical protein MOQ97_03275 [Cronobacter sakazakii]